MGKDGNKEEQDTYRNPVRISRENSSCRELLLAPKVRGFISSRIPKHITTFDEKFALRCLELIRESALRAAAYNFVSRVDALPEDPNNVHRFEAPGGPHEVITDYPAGDWTAGTVTYSPSMMNILKSPLLRGFGSIGYDANYGKKTILLEEADSPTESVDVLCNKNPIKEAGIPDVSASSSNSSCSGDSPSSATVVSLRGMLQCTWKNGVPRLVFSVDDKEEILSATLSKMESSGGEVTGCAYTFHSRKKGKKDGGFSELDFETVGTMDVSSSTTRGCNNTETMETRFVLSVPCKDPNEELQISSQNLRNQQKIVLSRRVANAFRSRSSFKQRRTLSKFEGQNVTFEENSRDLNPVESNLELAAIIVKEVSNNPPMKEVDSGGWGMKFLKKLGHDASPKKTMHEECSPSLTVLIPAGVHGGPRTGAGGPAGLVERWASGGRCDCGGWDVGCPLTVLGSRSSHVGSVPGGDGSSGECKSVNLFKVGSKQDLPVLKMVNIHEGLYYIHFEPNLSFLQSFAIAASILHCRSPLLRSKVYRK